MRTETEIYSLNYLDALGIWRVEAMKKLRAYRVDSPTGEIHFILEETSASKYSGCFKDFDTTEIKKISRKEAAKPLALFRDEWTCVELEENQNNANG